MTNADLTDRQAAHLGRFLAMTDRCTAAEFQRVLTAVREAARILTEAPPGER